MFEALKEKALELKEKVTKNPLERALAEATSNENWNASNRVLSEIADHTYSFNDFTQVMQYIWARLSSPKKKWRKTLKTLNLIEYLIKNGSPRCIQEFRDEQYQIRMLQELTVIEEGADRGASIRETSKRIVELLNDDTKIDEERKKSQEMREKLGDIKGYGSGGYEGGGASKYGGSSGGSSSWKSGGGSKFEGYGSKDAGKYSGSGSTGSTWKSDSHYDDNRKAGKWRVEKDDDEDPDFGTKTKKNDDFVVKSGTKYDIDLTKDDKPKKTTTSNEQPKKLAGPGQKKFTPIGGGGKVQTQSNNNNDGGDLLGMDEPPA
mmetsp:Transcript_1636/g.1459  ORF Transcript_1636/g.1459 Transcript_1636/m.1459 type:complete len:319 (-) Transcript_1636:228-1184(-)